jgi:hypothetical protein
MTGALGVPALAVSAAPAIGVGGLGAAVLCAMAVALAALLGRIAPPATRLHRLRADRTRGRSAAGPDRSRGPVSAPVLLDLVAQVLASGASPARAVAVVGQAVSTVDHDAGRELLGLAARLSAGGVVQPRARPGQEPAPTARDGSGAGARDSSVTAVLEQTLDLALSTGASPVGMIRTAAEQERRQRTDQAVRSARRLGVLVLLPTGLCLLPAFVLLTVVPLVLDLVLG